jgi:hypothetical protein
MPTIDDPAILRRLFYPQQTPTWRSLRPGVETVLFDLGGGIQISGRFCPYDARAPTVIFFHGNGEVSADYELIGPSFGTRCGANFLVLDYRGYGESTGQPSNTAMIADARALFPQVLAYLSNRDYIGPHVVMGRSLGSASALEIGLTYPTDLAAMILESAFADPEPLLAYLGVPRDVVNQIDCSIISNVTKIASISLPLLVIHGEGDTLIPASHGRKLFKTSPAALKEICIIPEAEHNTILLYDDYFEAMKAFLQHSAEKMKQDEDERDMWADGWKDWNLK